MDLGPGTIVGQKFRLEAPLAGGGMGSVWLARHVTLGSRIAVKFISATDANDVARARFEREARAASRISSPHVVKILDYGVDDRTPFIAMELLSGEDLSQRLAREGRLDLRAVARLMSQVTKGLGLAHAEGIVHRDLKPSNIFLARSGGEEIAKVLDFGVAKTTRASLSGESTATGTLVGSPEYMSPEQARALPLDHRSDIWSLGVVAFFALTGERPFAGKSFGDTMVKICSDEIPSARSFVSHLPEALDDFFARALSRNPDGRFSAVAEFAEELEAIASAAPDIAVVGEARRGARPRSDETLPAGVAIERLPAAPRFRRRRLVWAAAAIVGASALGSWFVTAPRAHHEVPTDRALVETQAPEANLPPMEPSPPASSSPPMTAAPPDVSPPVASVASPLVSHARAPTTPPVRRGRALPPPPTPTATTRIDRKYGLPVSFSP
jgi:serine/threonine-protein kinase